MKRRDAFSLTELLVLLPVIAMLGALLLAPLDSAKQTLQGAQCLSNLRQWGLALALYANDNQDYTPYGGSGNGYPINTPPNDGAWFNVIPHYINQPSLRDLYTSTPPRIPLPGTRSVYICPSALPGSQGNLGTDVNNPCYVYQINRVLNGALAACPNNLYKRIKVALPGQVVFMCDSDLAGGSTYPFTDGGFLAGSNQPRHHGGDNFVFVDGHAAWESSSVYSNGFPAGTANANSEWITPRQIYWFPCKTCDKRCP